MTWLHLSARGYGYDSWNAIKPVSTIFRNRKVQLGFRYQRSRISAIRYRERRAAGPKPRFYAVSDAASEAGKASPLPGWLPVFRMLKISVACGSAIRDLILHRGRQTSLTAAALNCRWAAAMSGNATTLTAWVRVFSKSHMTAQTSARWCHSCPFTHRATCYGRADRLLSRSLAQTPPASQVLLYVPLESSPWLRHRDLHATVLVAECTRILLRAKRCFAWLHE